MGRFTRKGISKIYFTATLASTTAPSVAAIVAGTALHVAIAAIDGFTFENSPIETPDLEGTFVKTIGGEDKVGGPKMTFYDDDTATTVRTALAKGSSGFLTFCPYGATATKRAETWAVISTGYNDAWTVGNEAAQASVSFVITAIPNQNATLAA